MRLILLLLSTLSFSALFSQFRQSDERNFKERFRDFYLDTRFEVLTSISTGIYKDFPNFNQKNFNYTFVGSYCEDLVPIKKTKALMFGTYLQVASYGNGDNDLLAYSTPFDSRDTSLFAYNFDELFIYNFGFSVGPEYLVTKGVVFGPYIKLGLASTVVSYSKRPYGTPQINDFNKFRNNDYLDVGAGFNFRIIFSNKIGFNLNYVFQHPLFLQFFDTGLGQGDDNIGTKISFYDLNFGIYFNVVKD